MEVCRMQRREKEEQKKLIINVSRVRWDKLNVTETQVMDRLRSHKMGSKVVGEDIKKY